MLLQLIFLLLTIISDAKKYFKHKRIHLDMVNVTEDASFDPTYPDAKNFTYSAYRLSEKAKNMSDPMIPPYFRRPLNESSTTPAQKYYLSIVSMFKNEAHSLKEWMEHHIAHGFEHFYLVNDKSSDNCSEVLEPYIKRGLVTLFPPPSKNIRFRQIGWYKNMIMGLLASNETQWVAFIDLDEFIWSPDEVNIASVLRRNEALSCGMLSWLWFGSNGHVTQPSSIIHSFTKRADPLALLNNTEIHKIYKILQFKTHKFIYNTRFRCAEISVHELSVEGLVADMSNQNQSHGQPRIFINHYSVQSKNFFLETKGKRGSANGFYKVTDRNEEWFRTCDINDIVDDRLSLQNQALNLTF